MEIDPVVDCAVPAEDKPGGCGVTRGRAAARTAVWSFDRFLLIHFGNSVLVSTFFLIVSPLSAVTTVALMLSFALVLAFLALGVLAFLAFISTHSVDFYWHFSHCPLNGLAAMTVSPLSNFPLSAS